MSSQDMFLPIALMFFVTVVIAVGALALGYFLGPKKFVQAKVETYECGVKVSANNQSKISIKYYLVAILFLLFDLEAALLIPVAIAWGEMQKAGLIALGLTGFFLLFFVASIWFELRSKALEWERTSIS